MKQLSLPHLCTLRFFVLNANLGGFFCSKGALQCSIMCQTPNSLPKEPSETPIQERTGDSWFVGIVLYYHRNYAHPITIYNQFVHAIHTMKKGVQMHMFLIPEVTHVIYKRCNCHPITIQDVAVTVTTAGQDASFLINNLGAPCSNSIPIVYSNWLQDCNSQDVLLTYIEYLVYRV